MSVNLSITNNHYYRLRFRVHKQWNVPYKLDKLQLSNLDKIMPKHYEIYSEEFPIEAVNQVTKID